ncbi:ABC-type metal ion transporter, periplasmic subunit [Pseudonocardia dioxanivorans CB1190]|uniref:ABC-type metal ion transporter, periplasmic subunit n=1 Tax=Pseudonocardia dioxanivorans (strain ATCC 55486 / DSM 44775 / JCM 13855 / CB1190) TaxID=675635 RepID=F4CLR5_PSEUX|nr:zinc ABC transporter substrate-binding protein [Pseudonocardia dioxanivorans]AEA28197.1 ABC-type metal ion transporter, periplasmic subunit [Pseudonocardia dioxanivorans CB1190]GJF02770.1 metal ABC transporter substrate-binding protein [Pseudonocardia sp. D17]
MHLRRTAVTIGGLLLTAATLAACGSGGSTNTAADDADGKVAVVASTDVYGSIVRAVGGDHVDVTSIIDDPAKDPHEYETTPADALAVSKAALVVVNGAGYDDFATKLVDAAESKPTTIDVAQLSGLQQQVPAGEEFNEHVWYNLPTMKRLATELAADLGRIDAADAATYTANAAAFSQRIDGLTAALDAVKSRHDGAAVAITEPVPLYLLEAAGLRNVTPEKFSEAAEEGNDPPAAVLQETLALFRDRSVKALVSNAQTESPSTTQVEQAATAAGIPVVRVTETLPAGTTDYVSWQSQQIDALTRALG